MSSVYGDLKPATMKPCPGFESHKMVVEVRADPKDSTGTGRQDRLICSQCKGVMYVWADCASAREIGIYVDGKVLLPEVSS